jgi:hypothetical protein
VFDWTLFFIIHVLSVIHCSRTKQTYHRSLHANTRVPLLTIPYTYFKTHYSVIFFFSITCVQQTGFILLCIFLFVALFASVNPPQITVEMRVQMTVGLHLKCPIFRQYSKTPMVWQFPATFWILKFKKFYLAGFELQHAYRRTGGFQYENAWTRTRKRSWRSHTYRL